LSIVLSLFSVTTSKKAHVLLLFFFLYLALTL
jgi:hypothetical protein